MAASLLVLVPPGSAEAAGTAASTAIAPVDESLDVANAPSENDATTDAGTVPAAPNVIVGPGPLLSQANVAWTTPNNGGSPITGYVVVSSPGHSKDVGVVNGTTMDLLQPNTSYRFMVAAKNDNGTGPFSQPSNVFLTKNVPSPPLNVNAVVTGATNADVTWDAPVSDGGTPITGWTVYTSPDDQGCTVDPDPMVRSATCDGLPRGTTVTFQVAAVNGIGTSELSAPSNAVNTPKPTGPPLNIVPTLTGPSTAQLTWNPPADNGGAPVSMWTIYAYPGATTCTPGAPAPVRTATCPNLKPNTEYTFRVYGLTVALWGVISDESPPITTPSLPGPPVNVNVAKDTVSTSTVTWDAPLDDGGTPIVDWEVHSFPGGGSCDVHDDIAMRTATCYSLLPGRQYEFRALARNAIGRGDMSVGAMYSTPSLPSAPLNPNITLSSPTTIDVMWDAPADDGGDPIVEWIVYLFPSGQFCPVDPDLGARTATCEAVGGRPNVARVVARNLAGYGAVSVSSNSVTPSGSTPFVAAPTNVTATKTAFNTFDISWNPVAGASAYVLYSDPGGYVASTTNTTLSHQVPDVGDTPFRWFVQALGAAGSLPSASTSPPQMYDPPVGAPVPTATKTSAQGVLIDWPDIPGSTGYFVYRSPGGYIGAAVGASELTDLLDVPGVDHRYFAIAFGNAGGSGASAFTDAVQVAPPTTPPPAPTVSLSAWDTVQVDWDDVRGAHTYWIFRSPGGYQGQSNTSNFINVLPTTGFDYRYYVVPFGDLGGGNPSPTSEPIQRLPRPNPPQNLTMTRVDNNTVELDWDPVPGALTYFVYNNRSLLGGTAQNNFVADLPIPNTDYTFFVIVGTQTGNSFASAMSAPIQQLPLAAAVTGIDATPIDNDSVELTWTPTAPEPLFGTTQYEIWASPGGHRGFADAPPFTVNGLPDAAKHKFMVRPIQGGVYGYLLPCVQASCETGTPAVSSRTPATIGNTGETTITFTGQHLQGVTGLTLTRNLATITTNEVTVDASGEKVVARVNLGGAATGVWTMSLTRAGGGAPIPAKSVTVAAANTPIVDVALTGRTGLFFGLPGTYTLTATNRGNVDALGAVVHLGGFPRTATVEPLFETTEIDSGVADPLPDMGFVIEDDLDQDPRGFIPVILHRLLPGQSRVLKFRITANEQGTFELDAWSSSCLFSGSGPGVGDASPDAHRNAGFGDTIGGVRSGSPADFDTTAESDACFNTVGKLIAENFFEFAITELSEYAECTKTVIGGVKTIVQRLFDDPKDDGKSATFGVDLIELMADLVKDCTAVAIPQAKALKTIWKAGKAAWKAMKIIEEYAQSCWKTSTRAKPIPVAIVVSSDPNEKVGPVGAGDEGWYKSGSPFGYEVHFENMATATAPAHIVRVTDVLDPATFDLSSLKLGSLQFGETVIEAPESAQEWHQTIDMRPGMPFLLRIDVDLEPATGKLDWVITTLDPETGLLHEDPFVGFLPPNNANNDGQGAVTFVVNALNPTQGMVVENDASIIFDANAPIVTNTWVNTIDATMPTATFGALPASSEDPSIDLTWSGADVGSGIEAYEVSVATDGGPFVGFISNIDVTNAVYDAEPGHTYQFRVRARDAAGNYSAESSSTVLKLFHKGSFFHGLSPTRLLDTRTGLGGFGGKLGAGAGKVKGLTVTGGATGVPANAEAVVLNVTATNGTLGSFLTLYPAGAAAVPTASNVNFGAGQTIPNLVTVKVGTGGKVNFYNELGSVDVIADLVGYYDDGYTPADRFNPIDPVRALDSRGPTGGFGGKLGAGAANVKALDVDALAEVPDTATAVIMNVTATGGSHGSFLTLYPAGAASVPTASNVNFAPGETIPNLVTVKLGTDGKVNFYNEVGTVDVVADVVGFYDPTQGDLFNAISPTRALDSRGSTGGWPGPLGAGAGNTRPLDITSDTTGVPAEATAAVTNTTVTGGTANSFLTVYPTGAASVPNTSNLNFGAGQTIPNLVVSKLGTNGQLHYFNANGTVHVIVDITGYFVPQS